MLRDFIYPLCFSLVQIFKYFLLILQFKKVHLERYDANGRVFLNPSQRLDTILKRKADEGVNIYVLPWSETKIMPLDSAGVKAYFGIFYFLFT